MMPNFEADVSAEALTEANIAARPGLRLQGWVVALVGALALAATGHLLIKFGLNIAARFDGQQAFLARLLHYFLEPAVLVGLCIYGVGTVLWVFAVSKKDISYLFPMTAVNYALISLGGMMLFAETISPRRWLGILVVVVGVVLMNLPNGENAP